VVKSYEKEDILKRYTFNIVALIFLILVVGLFANKSSKDGCKSCQNRVISVFEKNKDSVVFITTAKEILDPYTRNIYEIPRGAGSGIVWDKDGDIVTNYHVIKGASDAIIRLKGGATFNAKLIGVAPQYDLALLKIDAPSKLLKPAKIGDSSNLKVGQFVLAIGNPFGLDWTLTRGIISALGREYVTGDGYKIYNVIQTDAAINPGNSGGPLLDLDGRLIGVNTAIYSTSGSSAGIGLAIPINKVKSVIEQLKEYGYYKEPWLGIIIDKGLNRYVKERYGIKGVAIVRVVRGSGAYDAGLIGMEISPDGRLLALGDIIKKIDGEKVKKIEDIYKILQKHKVGDILKVEVLRGKERKVFKVKLKERR